MWVGRIAAGTGRMELADNGGSQPLTHARPVTPLTVRLRFLESELQREYAKLPPSHMSPRPPLEMAHRYQYSLTTPLAAGTDDALTERCLRALSSYAQTPRFMHSAHASQYLYASCSSSSMPPAYTAASNSRS